MVDCIYYEEANIDKEAIKNQFNARFGKEYDLHQDIADEKYIITADDIVNITPKVYGEVLLGTFHKYLTTTKNCPNYVYKRYYNSLSLLAMINAGNSVSKLEEIERHPLIVAVRNNLNEQ
jgi:hypothetical protein